MRWREVEFRDAVFGTRVAETLREASELAVQRLRQVSIATGSLAYAFEEAARATRQFIDQAERLEAKPAAKGGG